MQQNQETAITYQNFWERTTDYSKDLTALQKKYKTCLYLQMSDRVSEHRSPR